MNDSLIGTHIAGYRIERLLGRGGMASVYFAWDTRRNRAVALKVMDERYRDTPSYIDRFVHEAQTIQSWDQPNIVRVLDAGEENQIYYYAMEFIRGLDLSQLLRQYQDAGQLMPNNEVVRIGWAVANALDYAHQRGIIHRDVKPSNVLVSVDGRILLSDFGLVMDIRRGTLGETFGSPAYIAPEQARSSAGAVPQSDLYALGVVLYEMLTGVVPFYDASPAALALKHLTEAPPRPRVLNPRLNPSVEAVLLRALQKNPLDRYTTGREMMSALERSLSAELRGEEATLALPMPFETQALHTQRARAATPRAQAHPALSSSPNEPRPFIGPVQSGPPPGNRGVPPISPDPAVPQSVSSERARQTRWGCLALLLAAGGLAIVIGVALALNRNGFGLFPGPALTATPSPTTTAVSPSATPVPPTATASFTPTPSPSATPTPTATATPAPALALMLAYVKEDGFLLVNSGKDPLPLAPFELRNPEDRKEMFMTGEDWQVSVLKPDECVSAWLDNTRPRFPSNVQCNPIGKVLNFKKKERFWNKPVDVYYNNERIGTCKPDNERCTFDSLPPEPVR